MSKRAEEKNKRLLELLAGAEIAFAAKPPKIDEVRFVAPEIIEPVSRSGQERRRDRMAIARKNKKH